MQHIGDLSEILETTEPTKVASGFIFTEGPLWHPDDFWYFVDIRQNKLLRLVIGSDPELVRETKGGNGNTFDLEGRLINCEGLARRVTRTNQDGSVETIASAFQGGRLARPNDAICHSNGDIYFTDPDQRVAFHEREIPGRDGIDGKWIGSGVYRLSADGELSLVVQCEYPNGLAFSPDEKRLYVANTRTCKFIHVISSMPIAFAGAPVSIFWHYGARQQAAPSATSSKGLGEVAHDVCTWRCRRRLASARGSDYEYGTGVRGVALQPGRCFAVLVH